MEPQADMWFDAAAADGWGPDAVPPNGEGAGSPPDVAGPADPVGSSEPAETADTTGQGGQGGQGGQCRAADQDGEVEKDEEDEEPDSYTEEELDAGAVLPPGDPELLLARAVGDLLFTYRRMHRLTQAQLARRMGVDQARVSRLEQGRRSVSFVLLARVAAVTGSTVHVELRPGRRATGVRRVTTAAGLHHGAATVTVLGPRPPAAPLSPRWPTAIS
jgi:transcriptional regulator with XRE-family HTH domain